MGTFKATRLVFALWVACAVQGLASVAHAQLEGEIKNLEWVGFQQFDDVSRVFVRTTEPTLYAVEQTLPDTVVLVLENTRVPIRNNLNHLDTRWFQSPIFFIQPKSIEGPSPSVRIEIKLRRGVRFTETQKDTLLALDFPRS